MKQLVLSLLCLLAAVSLRAADDVNIVFIGNSITYGATLPDRATQAPPVHVGKAIAQQTGRHVEVRNCGVSGATTTDFLPIADHYWPPVVKAADELSQLKGQLVFTIMLGTNDSAQDGCFGAPVAKEQYYTNLKVIIDELLQRYPKAKVVVQYPLWYSESTYNATRYMRAGLMRLKSYHPMIDRLLESYAQQKPRRVFPGLKETFSYVEGRTDLFTTEQGNAGPFYLHPNPQGAIELANFWAASIVRIL